MIACRNLQATKEDRDIGTIHQYKFGTKCIIITVHIRNYRDFLGMGPVVKISPTSTGGRGLIPGWGAKSPHTSWPKNQNIKQK